MIQSQIPPFQPGMQFRRFDYNGPCTIMEQSSTHKTVFFKDPGGTIHNINPETLHRRLYITKEYIEEPELTELTDSVFVRAWIKQEKRMQYDITGLAKHGNGWGLGGDSKDRFYTLFFKATGTGTTYHESEVFLMPRCAGLKDERGELLYAYDIISDPLSGSGENTKIIFPHPSSNLFVFKDYRNVLTVLSYINAPNLKKTGNIFENPEHYDLFVKSQHMIKINR